MLLKNPAGYRKMAIFFIKNFSEVKRVRTKCAAMSKKWIYFDEEKYFATPLGDIRATHGIVL